MRVSCGRLAARRSRTVTVTTIAVQAGIVGRNLWRSAQNFLKRYALGATRQALRARFVPLFAAMLPLFAAMLPLFAAMLPLFAATCRFLALRARRYAPGFATSLWRRSAEDWVVFATWNSTGSPGVRPTPSPFVMCVGDARLTGVALKRAVGLELPKERVGSGSKSLSGGSAMANPSTLEGPPLHAPAGTGRATSCKLR